MRTRVKFCGLTRQEDVEAAVALGVDAIGLVFDPRSRRYLSVADAARLRAQVPPLVAVVALFRNAAAAEVKAVLDAVQPDLLQFHGDESPAYCAAFGRRYIKAVAMGGGAEPQRASMARVAHAAAVGLLLDGHALGESGGSGQRFNWHRVPSDIGPWILAGGLEPENIGEAITMARPFAVDVSSGIETAPGIKCPLRMRLFLHAVRRADESKTP